MLPVKINLDLEDDELVEGVDAATSFSGFDLFFEFKLVNFNAECFA